MHNKIKIVTPQLEIIVRLYKLLYDRPKDCNWGLRLRDEVSYMLNPDILLSSLSIPIKVIEHTIWFGLVRGLDGQPYAAVKQRLKYYMVFYFHEPKVRRWCNIKRRDPSMHNKIKIVTPQLEIIVRLYKLLYDRLKGLHLRITSTWWSFIYVKSRYIIITALYSN